MRNLIAHGWAQPTRYPEPMGLEAIDIVLRYEETFDLRLEDEAAGVVPT